MKIFSVLLLCMLLLSTAVFAENYLINGGQESQIDYQMIQKVEPKPQIKRIYLTFVKPVTFESPTYSQRVTNPNFKFAPTPDNKEEYTDKRGNSVIKATWNNPASAIESIISFSAMNQTKLEPLKTGTPFPMNALPADVQPYLTATKQVPSTDPQIVAKAKELTTGASTEFDAVQRILTWVIDHMHYVLTPESYEAMYSFNTGKGNCQNYSHLSSALMRAVGIPARIVNGVTLKRPYNMEVGDRTFTLKMAEGRHSWIEVWFSDLGWVPFDPQQTALFVSNRFIRVEVGLDNAETSQDGLIRWAQSKGALVQPEFEEVIDSKFSSDQVKLAAQIQPYGPQKMLLVPDVKAAFKQTTTKVEPPPKRIDPTILQTLKYDKPFLFGNLEFPEGVDFINTRGPAEQGDNATFEMKKNFLVETAEYVTSGAQYAQIAVLTKPVKLGVVSLALHKFGGNGQMWVELRKDYQGMPGETIATSDFIALEKIPFKPGYYWVDFDFKRDWPILQPGKYWIALGFTGQPIVNWFYTYGKSVGPVDGTRYKTVLDEEWSKALSYEFNYRIVGLTTNQ
ncbi:transglutaminase domain-containing protein [candidate division KSB1 bacterium]|nr:transglutaminase domain-containing protein [candidate division KSB1 bacterium]